MVSVPDVVRNKALAAGATEWLRDLPELVESLVDEWGLSLGRVYDGGTEAFVAEATIVDDGTPAVLKVMVPRSAGRDLAVEEITVLRLCRGEGCVEMLRCDEARGAFLVERLGPSMFDLRLPFEQRLPTLVDVAAQVWRPVPPGTGLPTGGEKGLWLADTIATLWEKLGRPCDRWVIDHAVDTAKARAAAHDDANAVLVHGDVHQWNTLQTLDGRAWKLVDPDGLEAEPEYDLGIIMREDPIELMADGNPRNRSRWLAERTGLDEVAIWEWGVVERVSTALVCIEVDLQPVGGQMLDAATAIAATAR